MSIVTCTSTPPASPSDPRRVSVLPPLAPPQHPLPPPPTNQDPVVSPFLPSPTASAYSPLSLRLSAFQYPISPREKSKYSSASTTDSAQNSLPTSPASLRSAIESRHHGYHASTSTTGGLDPVLDAFPSPSLARTDSAHSAQPPLSPWVPASVISSTSSSTHCGSPSPAVEVSAAYKRQTTLASLSMLNQPAHSQTTSPLIVSEPQGYSHNSTTPVSNHTDRLGESNGDADRHCRHSISPATQPDLPPKKSHSSSQHGHPLPLKRERSEREDETIKLLHAFIGIGDLTSSRKDKTQSSASSDSKRKSKRRDFLGLDLYFGGTSKTSSSKASSLRRGNSKSQTTSAESIGSLATPPRSTSLKQDKPPVASSKPMYGISRGGPSHISQVAKDEDEMCPVCLEPLAMRLRGERPHVSPVCGHRLHSSCFEAVYGSVEVAKKKGGPLGLCGVCRRDMKLGEDDGPGKSGKSKFAMMAGIPGRDNGETFDSHKVRSISRRTLNTDLHGGLSLHDPAEDDEIVASEYHPTGNAYAGVAGVRRRSSVDTLQANKATEIASRGRTGSNASGERLRNQLQATTSSATDRSSVSEREIAHPKITVTSEQPTLTRSSDREKNQHLTCMVTIEMPPKYPTQHAPIFPNRHHSTSNVASAGLTHSARFSLLAAKVQATPSHSIPVWPTAQTLKTNVDRSPTLDADRPDSPGRSSNQSSTDAHKSEEPSHGALQEIVDDLRARIHDWKGHDPETFGRLHLFDYLSVRKNHQSREFLLYLFEETLLCVDENKRATVGSSEKLLRLRGRVYARHIRRVRETSTGPADLTLTVDMEQRDLEAFVISFKERPVLQVWKEQIAQLVDRQRHTSTHPVRGSVTSEASDHTRMTSSSDGYSSSAYTRQTHSTDGTSAPPLSAVGEDEEMTYGMGKMALQPMAETRDIFHHHSADSSLHSLSAPRDFVPIDLMLILSVPASSPSAPSSYTLKLRLLRQALDFVINTIGPRARISVVTYSSGEGSRAQLRKTPFLAVGRESGRQRLQKIIDEIGQEAEKGQSGILGMIDHAEDKVSVVTAVNLALDIVLQRKQKSSLSGIILMNDARDCSSKPQMSLVMARAEAANLPIHTFGWGRGHDPSSLWQLSHHTGGTYTFIPDWYSLKDCLAGCIGGMLSIAVTTFRLHISVPERRWFRIRKVAGINSIILSADGKDADIDLAELRFGEKRELLVEMEMLPSPVPQHEERRQAVSTATDEFFLKRTGLNPMNSDDMDGNLYDAEFDDLVEEVPLFEVDASYKDPAVGKHVSRLPYPVLLTVTIAPPNPPGVRSPPVSPEPAIVRRRIEVLTSDALTRALLLLSRNNEAQAQRLLSETKRIVNALMLTIGEPTSGLIPSSLPSNSTSPMSGPASGKTRDSNGGVVTSNTTVSHMAQDVLAACAEDISTVLQGLHHRQTFDQMERNFAAQQAVVLREQRSWTGRSATERAFWAADHSLWFAAQAAKFT